MKSLPDFQMLIEERPPSSAKAQEDAGDGNHGAVLTFYTPQTMLVLLNSAQRLRLPQQPPKSFVPALPLQLCSNHFPALLMVLVHPVTLEKGRGRTVSTNKEESL